MKSHAKVVVVGGGCLRASLLSGLTEPGICAGVILGRSLSFFIDGMPRTNLIRGAIVEGVLAVLNMYCLVNSLLQAKGSVME